MLKRGDSYIYFAGTSIGLFSTDELAGNHTVWIQEGSTAFGNIIIDHIVTRESDGCVAIATQGFGVWTTNVPDISDASDKITNHYFSLDQNYPNPANKYTNIKFTLASSGYVKLKIYDIHSKLIMQPLDKYMSEGRHFVHINTSLLKNGSYFYCLETNLDKLTRKMIVDR
jgi:hypothetical protein